MEDKSADARIAATMKIIWHKDGNRNYVTDTDAFDYNGSIGIKYRGNSSYYNSEKKPFAIQTWNSSGKKEKASILGMPKDDDWALLAPFNDKSMIRDILTYELMRGTLEYVPTGKYCELILNGVYQGVYIMAARVKQGDNRINIKKPTADSGDGLTGGYHLEIDRNDSPGFWGAVKPKDLYEKDNGNLIYYQYKYPDEEDLTAAQKNYIQTKIKNMEYAFSGTYFKSPVTGYRAFVDTLSLMDFFIAQELTKNVDGYRLSTPLYKDVDSKNPRFKFSIWDFNISMGNADYYSGWGYEGWAYNMNRFSDNNMAPWMFKRVLQDEVFYSGLKDRWGKHRENRLSDENIVHIIDSLANVVQEAQVRNFTVWNRFSSYVWPNYYIASSWNDEVSYLKKWIQLRTEWVDSQWKTVNPNLVANGSFEGSGKRGIWNDVWVSDWTTWGNNAGLSTTEVFQGNYSMSLRDNCGIYQVIGELTPGKYTLKAQVNAQGSPDGYMYVKYHQKKDGTDEIKIKVQNETSYHLIEIKDIQVQNTFVEVGFGAVYKNSSTRMRIDNVEFFRQDIPNSIKENKMETFTVLTNPQTKGLELHLNAPARNLNVEIFNVSGVKIYSRIYNETMKINIENIFTVKGVYVVRAGNVSKKILF